ncbi:Chaperone protein DnaJ [Tetrabaena socialis]|uniref:Chaperone protein DnaJ n=1 Tax=Tetrabaena socialis TaxID=47790 RepID=A0A2J8A8U0_9CHLO|nr:Chaperone protein DnaJ [Tetrabaena socialis]|eukprot:PNH08952.1 Chaperone protein DnaJ [Tetrabaena socialis]
MSGRDYDVLGLTSTASVDEVKAAFRRQAKVLHPDVSKSGDVGLVTQVEEDGPMAGGEEGAEKVGKCPKQGVEAEG